MHKGKRKVKSLNKNANVNTYVEENVEGINVNDCRAEIQENSNKRKRECLTTINQIREPNSYIKIFKRKDKDKQINVIENELNNMKERKVFKKIEKVPEGANIIDSRWVFKIKRDSEGKIDKYIKQDKQQEAIPRNMEKIIKKLFHQH